MGGTSATVVLIRICCKPQNPQQASNSSMAGVSSLGLRSGAAEAGWDMAVTETETGRTGRVAAGSW